MQLHEADNVIPLDAAANVFRAALVITLFLNTQNNCVRGESSTMEATDLLHGDPVPTCVRRYLHLQKENALPDTPF